MNYRLLNPSEIIKTGDEAFSGRMAWEPTAFLGREFDEYMSPIRRPIVSAWLPIVQGEVTFPCLVLNHHPDYPGEWQSGLLTNAKYLSTWKWWQPANLPEQLSPGEKAWVEHCAKQKWPNSPKLFPAMEKQSFLAGYEAKGDNERK